MPVRVRGLSAPQTPEEDGDQPPGNMSHGGMPGDTAVAEALVIHPKGGTRAGNSWREQLHGREPHLPASQQVAADTQRVPDWRSSGYQPSNFRSCLSSWKVATSPMVVSSRAVRRPDIPGRLPITLSLQGRLHQQADAEAGHLLEDDAQLLPGGEEVGDLAADLLGGGYSSRHGRWFLHGLVEAPWSLSPVLPAFYTT